MATTLVQRPGYRASVRVETYPPTPNEFVVICPKCKTIETLLFSGGHLLENRKFSERNGSVYHDCGSAAPCRCYRSMGIMALGQKEHC